jgi:hypothetical protein
LCREPIKEHQNIEPQWQRTAYSHIIFLDFNGVLHARDNWRSDPFCYMENFCAVMRSAGPTGRLPVVSS